MAPSPGDVSSSEEKVLEEQTVVENDVPVVREDDTEEEFEDIIEVAHDLQNLEPQARIQCKCNCTLFNGHRCINQFSPAQQDEIRYTVKELTEFEKDLMILRMISSSINDGDMTARKKKNNDLKLKIEEQNTSFMKPFKFFYARSMNRREKLIEADTELQVKREYIDHLEPKVTSNVDKMKLMQSQLVKKEQDMKAMEERYKKYLEKAKAVIRTLDPKHNPGSAPEIQALKNQLQEKQRTIELLESEKERSKVTRDNEEKLIVSAWYNMGMNLHRKAAEDRLIHSGGGQSFLARQRQASQKRSQSITGSNSMNR
ncbi:protein Hook homolog 2-like [Anneissia japonica]|uniref:protein Hook homolog 2-like n=1 Tax=Anneissia japonica TaxID=1529436 RepID=UPI001425A630|nr:protein Hook homolog 2-like [Anneissia japonica]